MPFRASLAFCSAAKSSVAFPVCSAEYTCTLASPSSRRSFAKFSRLMYKVPIKPPTLSVFSTSISTSRCMQRRLAKSCASWPNGSGFSEGLRAERGARMPERTKVNLAFSRGMSMVKREPDLTKSTIAGTFFCRWRTDD